MSKADELHDQAMVLADEADLARIRDRDTELSKKLLRAAYEKDRLAALQLIDRKDYEPTRSVYFRSAASLAFEIDAFDAATELVELALTGSPPQPIKEELQTLRENLRFKTRSAEEDEREAPAHTFQPSRIPQEIEPKVAQLMGLVAIIEPYLEEAMAKIPLGARQILLEKYELALPNIGSSRLPGREEAEGTYQPREARLLFNRALDSLLESIHAKKASRQMEYEQAMRLLRASY